MPSTTPDKNSLRGGLFSESAIYGLILISALALVSGTSDGSSLALLEKVLLSVAVLWAAHAFAEVLSHLSYAEKGEFSFSGEIKGALRHSIGLPIAAVIPLVILLLGVLNIIRDETAIWAVMWADIALLASLGYLASRRITDKPLSRTWVSLLTAAFGGIIMALKALIS